MNAPDFLGLDGRALWDDVRSKYDLRADEMRILQHACVEADLIDAMQAELSDLLTEGSRGQTVMAPVVSELRQHRTVLAALIRQLHLPEPEGETTAAGNVTGGRPGTVAARELARARWGKR